MVRSDRKAKNLYERLEEARTKRAEVLALKQPANDVPKAKTVAKVVPDAKKAPIPDAPAAQDRFPSIVMTPADKQQPEQPVAPRKPSWHIRAIAVIIAALGIFHLFGSESRPSVGESVDAQVAPAQIETLGSLAPSRDTATQTSQSAKLSVVERTSPQWPASGTPAQKPIIGRLPGSFDSPDFVTATDAQYSFADARLLLSTPESQPLLPTVDAKFAIIVPTELSVSLNIPRWASAREVRSVATALDKSGLEIRDPRIVDFTVKSTHLRFFHSSDASAATKLATKINGPARDFTNFTPAPPLGYVEVWIMGRPANRQSNGAPQRPLQGLSRDLRQLRAGLRNALRAATQ